MKAAPTAGAADADAGDVNAAVAAAATPVAPASISRRQRRASNGGGVSEACSEGEQRGRGRERRALSPLGAAAVAAARGADAAAAATAAGFELLHGVSTPLSGARTSASGASKRSRGRRFVAADMPASSSPSTAAASAAADVDGGSEPLTPGPPGTQKIIRVRRGLVPLVGAGALLYLTQPAPVTAAVHADPHGRSKKHP